MSEWKRHEPLNRRTPNDRASALQRAIGLGSAKTGAGHWWLQRVTAAALVPLLAGFIAALITHVDEGHSAVVDWLESPPVAVWMILLLVALFRHMMLGLRVMIEDYVHTDRLKFAVVVTVQAGCWVLMVIGVFAVLSIAFR